MLFQSPCRAIVLNKYRGLLLFIAGITTAMVLENKIINIRLVPRCLYTALPAFFWGRFPFGKLLYDLNRKWFRGSADTAPLPFSSRVLLRMVKASEGLDLVLLTAKGSASREAAAFYGRIHGAVYAAGCFQEQLFRAPG